MNKTFSSDNITYEKFIDVFRQLGTHTVHFEDRLDLIGGDYPIFKSYPRIFNIYIINVLARNLKVCLVSQILTTK